MGSDDLIVPAGLLVDIVKVDPQAFQKNQKRHFLEILKNPFMRLLQ